MSDDYWEPKLRNLQYWQILFWFITIPFTLGHFTATGIVSFLKVFIKWISQPVFREHDD